MSNPINKLADLLKANSIDKIVKAIDRSTLRWTLIEKELIKAEILESIERGVSPVSGKGRFKDYSDIYKQQILKGRYKRYNKRLRPVNLTLSGKMLRSIKARQTKNGFYIWFTDEKAKYHNELGAGKSKVIRRMLPTNKGEEFSRVIQKNIIDTYDKILENELRR